MNKNSFVLFLVFLLFVSCTQTKFETSNLKDGDKYVFQKSRPACEVPAADFILDAQVVEFKNVSNKNLSFGFGISWLKLFDFSFNLRKSQMTVKSSLAEILKPKDQIAPALGTSEYKSKSWGVDIDLSQIKAGYSSFSSTPMFSVLNNAFKDSTHKTSVQLDNIAAPWNTVVSGIVDEKSFLIPTGRNAGIEVGDEFEIYNVIHNWKGEPCNSGYIMATTTTEKPLAVVVVTSAKDLTPNASRLTVKEMSSSEKIEMGAFVYIHKLAKPKKLLRSVLVNKVKPFQISWSAADGSAESMDLTDYMNTALEVSLLENGFYIRSPE